jgi:hypothetical protein
MSLTDRLSQTTNSFDWTNRDVIGDNEKIIFAGYINPNIQSSRGCSG